MCVELVQSFEINGNLVLSTGEFSLHGGDTASPNCISFQIAPELSRGLPQIAITFFNESCQFSKLKLHQTCILKNTMNHFFCNFFPLASLRLSYLVHVPFYPCTFISCFSLKPQPVGNVKLNVCHRLFDTKLETYFDQRQINPCRQISIALTFWRRKELDQQLDFETNWDYDKNTGYLRLDWVTL